jgi:hypothetical protein
MHRKLERDATGLDDARLDALRQIEVVTVARRQIAAGLSNADDRLARLQLGARRAVSPG